MWRLESVTWAAAISRLLIGVLGFHSITAIRDRKMKFIAPSFTAMMFDSSPWRRVGAIFGMQAINTSLGRLVSDLDYWDDTAHMPRDGRQKAN